MATDSDIWTKLGTVLTTLALFFGIFISHLTFEWKAISVLFVWLAAATFYFDHKIRKIEIPKKEESVMEIIKNIQGTTNEIYKLIKGKKAAIDPVVLALAIIAFIFLALIFLQAK